MEVQHFVDHAQDLSDLELATLLCLIAKQHCLIETPDDAVVDLVAELVLIASEVFGLSYAVLSRDDYASTETFGESILGKHAEDGVQEDHVDSEDDMSLVRSRLSTLNIRSLRRSSDTKLDTRRVVHVIIAKDFNLASTDVQIQALELIRHRRIFGRTTIHPASNVLLFIPVISSSNQDIRLNKHLNDRIFISHYHDPEDGFANLEEIEPVVTIATDEGSTPLITRIESLKAQHGLNSNARIDRSIIAGLREMGEATAITPEIRRYLQDVLVFMRLERGVAGGISPYATTQLVALAKYLAPLHGLDFVTPSLVALAARKIYPHRILVSSLEDERSMQYGSDLEAVKVLLEDVTPESIIGSAFEKVPCPL